MSDPIPTDDLLAGACPNGHLTAPPHPRCPECGRPQSERIQLSERTGRIVTWTTSTATPPGVRSPNPIAIVEFDVDDRTVRTIGQLTTDDVSTGDHVVPVPVEALRDPTAGIRESSSQPWGGYRFQPAAEGSDAGAHESG